MILCNLTDPEAKLATAAVPSFSKSSTAFRFGLCLRFEDDFLVISFLVLTAAGGDHWRKCAKVMETLV